MLRDEAIAIALGKITSSGGSGIESQIDETGQSIRSYCNIKPEEEIPASLKYTWANMAVDLYRYEHAINSLGDEAPTVGGAVTRIKEGDTEVAFGGQDRKGRDAMSHHAALDRLVMDYKAQLNAHRALRGFGHGEN